MCIHCPSGPWFGRVLAVECMVCGSQLVRDKCPKGHSIQRRTFDDGHEGWTYFITIAQDNVPGDIRPWCIPERFPVTGRTMWERLEDPLVGKD